MPRRPAAVAWGLFFLHTFILCDPYIQHGEDSNRNHMIDMLARFFRWSNSKLIRSENLMVEKILKLFFFLSVVAYRRFTPRSPGRSCVVLIENFDSDLRLQVDRCKVIGAVLYWTGFHEFREFLFLHRYLQSGMVFVDVGANQGEYSLFAAKRLSKGKVFAFEPVASIRSAFKRNIALNGFENIEVYPFGLSSTNEMMVIHEFEDENEGLATLFPGSRHGGTKTSVELKAMDTIEAVRNSDRIDFIKIDVEGAELRVLEGCRSVIAQFRPAFMVEINTQTFRAAGYAPENVARFFADLDYAPYRIEKRGRIKACTAMPSFGNVLFMPQ